jgi:hypothetical protein
MDESLQNQVVGLGLSLIQVEKLKAEGVVSESDIGKLTAAEVKEITGCGLVTAKKVVEVFAPVPETVETAIVRAGEAAMVEVLPALPDGNKSFIEMLKTGGILLVDPINVLAAVSASISTRFNVDKIPKVLLEMMEEYAESQDKPAPKMFYDLEKIIVALDHGDLFKALNISGHFMNKENKKRFLDKMDSDFWKALASFQAQLESWWDIWTGELQNAGIAMMAFRNDKSGVGDDLSAELSRPDSGTLRAAAEVIINRINKLFAGRGIPTAMTIAYDMTQNRELLEIKELPQALGFGDKEQMLKAISKNLGASVEADSVELEKNVALFLLGIMKLSEVDSAHERRYLIGLRRLGKLIDWSKLGADVRRSGGPTSGSDSFRR